MSLEMTVDEIITELTMASRKIMNLIIEGEDDFNFFYACFDEPEKVNFLCAWGSENVEAVISHINLNNITPIKPTLGIIDRDYRIPLNNIPNYTNLLMTDLRDLECMMFDSRSFGNVIRELASSEKLRKHGGAAAAKKSVLAAAETIGRLRYYSQSSKINSSFKKLAIDAIICKKTLAIEHDELVEHLNARQDKIGSLIEKDSIPKAIAATSSAKCASGNQYFINPLLLCRGHDIMEIIAISMHSLLATMSSKECTGKNIEQRFRLNYPAYFRKIQLANDICNWIVSNKLSGSIAMI